jgi:large subunit ribosomal protein L31
MKTAIHPKYDDATITCACGEVIHTKSTVKEMRVELCSKCHPIFTGKQRVVDTEGIVDKFKKRVTAAEKLKKDSQGKSKKERRKKQPAKNDIKQIMAEQEKRRSDRQAEKKKVEDKKLQEEMKKVNVRKASKEELAEVVAQKPVKKEKKDN